MIYNLSPQGQGVLIIGTKELRQLRRGEPVMAPDGNFMVCWVPDMAHTENEFRGMMRIGKNTIDPKIMAYIMAEAVKRPEIIETDIAKPEDLRPKIVKPPGSESA